MLPIRSMRDVFAQSWLASQLRGVFGSVQPRAGKLPRTRPRRQRPDFALEVLEPRLLLSADVSYPTSPLDTAVTALTLQIVNSGGLHVRLTETGNPGNEIFSAAIAATENTINVSRATGGSVFADTVTVDLSTFDLLSPTGDQLTINFDGGMQDVFSDSVVLSGTASLGYSLTVNSNADIAVNGSVTLTDADDDIALKVDMTDTGLPTDALT